MQGSAANIDVTHLTAIERTCLWVVDRRRDELRDCVAIRESAGRCNGRVDAVWRVTTGSVGGGWRLVLL